MSFGYERNFVLKRQSPLEKTGISEVGFIPRIWFLFSKSSLVVFIISSKNIYSLGITS